MKKVFLLLFAFAFTACSFLDDSSSGSSKHSQNVDTLKVAVILPMNKEMATHWERTVYLFQDNLEKAITLSALDTAFVFDIEWIDEDKADMDSLGRALASRTKEISAIIGPYYSKNVDVVASYCSNAQYKKTLIVPMATAAEVVRKYRKNRWFFSLAETDITQSEMLLQEALASGAKQVSLLTGNTLYTNTFIDWFAFQATEMGLKIGGVYIYEDDAEIEAVAESAFSEEKDFVICVPDKYEDVAHYIKARQKTKSTARMLFSSSAHEANLLKLDGIDELEGFAIGANPESGFDKTYQAKFSDFPIAGEAQLYDALLLSAFAKLHLWDNPTMYFYDAFSNETAGDTTIQEYYAWEPAAMARAFESILAHKELNLSGASGNLNFSISDGSIINRSTYTHWIVSNKKFVPLEYISSKGSKRVVQSKSSINWLVQNYSSQFDSTSVFHYPDVQDNYALLVAASAGWENYRHQADVLKFYKKLKSLGMKDDHIILIMDDDLVNNPSNPYKGELLDYEEISLYESVKIDYKTSKIHPEDITSILMGEKREGLDKVVEADSTTNILVFWSGHGSIGRFIWGADSLDEGFSYSEMEDMLQKMSTQKKYRKMLWLVETCFSGSVCSAFDKVEAWGTMCISAANEFEKSKADLYNEYMGTYMTNSFTRNLMTEIDKIQPNSELTTVHMSDLYFHAVKNTIGSHVSVYNSAKFDNLYASGIDEFLLPATK